MKQLCLLFVLLLSLFGLISCERVSTRTEEESVMAFWLGGEHSPTLVYDACVRFGYPYSVFAKYCGETEIRHFVNGDTEHWYTVLPEDDNTVIYLFLVPDGNGDYMFDQFACSAADIRSNPHILRESILESDLPAAILGDSLPAHCKLEYYTAEEIERNVELQWSGYHEYCSQAALESYGEEFLGEEYCSYYRCVQFVMFDVIEGRNATSGLHNYDILCRTDGTGKLIYRHFLYSESGLFATLHSEQTRELSVAEMEEWSNLLCEVDFCNIPTWNPEEILGFDGETTYFYGSREDHLIAMWEADWERYGIYRIRTTLEMLVKAA